MANEISITASLAINKPSVMSSAIGRAVNALLFTMSGLTYIEGSITLLTSATAFSLGGVTAPHWAFFKNLDATNFVKLRNGVAGADFAQLYPGECAFVPLYTSISLYGIADTASCLVEFLVASY